MCVDAQVGRGCTAAKVIVMGEHSVVYGHPAVALPLTSLRMVAHARACAAGESTLSALGWSGPLAQAPARFASVVCAVEAALQFAGCADRGVEVSTVSDFPEGRGLGSSAAAAGAVIRAVLAACGASATSAELFELTQQAERVAHGRPSGLDAMATASQVPILFEQGRISPVDMTMRAWLVIADSGVSGSTRETVSHIRHGVEQDLPGVASWLAELGQLAADSVGDLRADRPRELGARMDRAHELLARLGVSIDALDRLVAASRRAGALGAKLTGGGRGGCIIALADSADAAQTIARAVAAAGATQTWIHPLHHGGVEGKDS